ncbi:MAG: hypothetical protein HKN47_27610 [Pirellulaceae bacterium]|nr:hypothetical protein [Pirellulaceae bacterium]
MVRSDKRKRTTFADFDEATWSPQVSARASPAVCYPSEKSPSPAMSLLSTLIALTDLGLLLAVVGVYVFFAALWVVYAITERGARRYQGEYDRFAHLQQETMGELSTTDTAAEEFVTTTELQLSEREISRDEQIQQLRAELTTVRDVSVMTGTRLQDLEMEVQQLQVNLESQLQAHQSTIDGLLRVDDAHVVVAEDQPESMAKLAAKLKLYDPKLDLDASRVARQDSERGTVYARRPAEPDDLTKIWGVGAVNQQVLQENGIYYFDQIASWDESLVAKFNEILSFSGRIEREDWVGQAARLVEAGRQQRAA